MKKFLIISSEMTKAFGLFVSDEQIEKVDHCPKRVHGLFIDKGAVDTVLSKNELQEKYFKGRCLSLGGGEIIEDLERLDSGKRSMIHKRIDAQVDAFRRFLAKRNINANIFNTKMQLGSKFGVFTIGEDELSVWIADDIDIFPTSVDFGFDQLAMIDVNLTTDVRNKFFEPNFIRTCSKGCWDRPEYIAKNRALFSHYIIRNFHHGYTIKLNEGNEEKIEVMMNEQVLKLAQDSTYYYAVFGTKAQTESNNQQAVIEYELTPKRLKLFNELVSRSMSEWVDGETTGWPAKPVDELCKKCTLQCKFKNADKKL